MHFIYVIRATRLGMLTDGPTPEESGVLGEHLVYLQGQASEGVVLLAGRTDTADDDTFGIVVFEAETEAAARNFMRRDAPPTGVRIG